MAQDLVHLGAWHCAVYSRPEHVRTSSRGALTVGGGCASGAAAQVHLAAAVDGFNGVGRLGNARVVVAVEEALGVTGGYLLGVFDEAAPVGTSTSLGRKPALGCQIGGELPADMASARSG